MKRLTLTLLALFIANTLGAFAHASSFPMCKKEVVYQAGKQCRSNFDCDIGFYCYGGSMSRIGFCMPKQGVK